MFNRQPIVFNISSLTLNINGESDMTSIVELEQQEIATLADISAKIDALATPTVTVDLTAVTDALAAISTKLDSVIAAVNTPV